MCKVIIERAMFVLCAAFPLIQSATDARPLSLSCEPTISLTLLSLADGNSLSCTLLCRKSINVNAQRTIDVVYML